MGQLQPIIICEQQQLKESDQEYVNNLGLTYPSVSRGEMPPHLGLSADGWSSYYVGATWLKAGKRPLVVLPKFDKIDFVKIFAEALNSSVKPEYFRQVYRINFDAPAIENGALNSVLSPLIVSHFLSVVSRLLQQGLKRNYIVREENLKCKVKGHILLLKNLQKNVIQGHSERTMCRYQEYSLDYPENQIIKRALLASRSLLLSMKSTNNELLQIVQKALLPFEGISSDITPSKVKTIRRDKLHGEYPLAISLAKQILKRTDYSIGENKLSMQRVPDFSIDMSRVFEFYVLGLLKEKYKEKEVLFQVYAGIMGRCDYLIPTERLIIDAKYKADYPNKSSDVLRDDIREVSGYGRSKHILEKLGIEDGGQPACVIIYPNGEYKEDEHLQEGELLKLSMPLRGVENFYTMGVALLAVE